MPIGEVVVVIWQAAEAKEANGEEEAVGFF